MGRFPGLLRFRGGGAGAEGTVGADRVVLPPPALDEDLGFQQGVEALAIEARVAQLAVERFPRAVRPRPARFDEAVVPPTRCSQSRTAVAVHAGPLSDRRNVGGPRSTNSWANRARPSSRRRRRATSRRRPSRVVLIHDGEDPHRAPLGGAVEDEGGGPDVGRPLGPPPHPRAGREPAAAPLGVLPGDPPAFLTPEPLDPLGVHPPALLAQQGRDATGTVAAEAGGPRDAARDQRRLIRGRPGHGALGRPRLAGDLAGPPLRHRVLVRAVGCRPAPRGRAQKFPAAPSRTIALARA